MSVVNLSLHGNNCPVMRLGIRRSCYTTWYKYNSAAEIPCRSQGSRETASETHRSSSRRSLDCDMMHIGERARAALSGVR